MKKRLTLLSYGLLAFSLAACTGSAKPPAPSGEESAPASVSVSYAVGDIILADGSAVKPDSLALTESTNFPAAVIAEIKEDGTALGLGVHRSSGPLPWTPDKDGEDAPVSADPQSSPAFAFVETYADTHHLNGALASGWYMPDISELCAIYENREEINASLSKIYSLDEHAAMDGLGTNWYWSSTQSETQEDYGWLVHFFNGYSSDCPKNFTNLHVLAVRAF